MIINLLIVLTKVTPENSSGGDVSNWGKGYAISLNESGVFTVKVSKILLELTIWLYLPFNITTLFSETAELIFSPLTFSIPINLISNTGDPSYTLPSQIKNKLLSKKQILVSFKQKILLKPSKSQNILFISLYLIFVLPSSKYILEPYLINEFVDFVCLSLVKSRVVTISEILVTSEDFVETHIP